MICSNHIVNELMEIARMSLEKNNITIIPVYYDSNGYVVYARANENQLTTLTLAEIETLVNGEN